MAVRNSQAVSERGYLPRCSPFSVCQAKRFGACRLRKGLPDQKISGCVDRHTTRCLGMPIKNSRNTRSLVVSTEGDLSAEEGRVKIPHTHTTSLDKSQTVA